MKKTTILFLYLLAVFLFYACEQENVPKPDIIAQYEALGFVHLEDLQTSGDHDPGFDQLVEWVRNDFDAKHILVYPEQLPNEHGILKQLEEISPVAIKARATILPGKEDARLRTKCRDGILYESYEDGSGNTRWRIKGWDCGEALIGGGPGQWVIIQPGYVSLNESDPPDAQGSSGGSDPGTDPNTGGQVLLLTNTTIDSYLLEEIERTIRELELESLLEQDPFALIENCDQINNWQQLAQHTPPQPVLDKIEELHKNNEGPLGDWDIQYLAEAGGAVVNMDYFAVKVSVLPNKPNTNTSFTAEEFLDYFRRNINDFANPSSFEPYCEIAALCAQETALWNSTDPLGAVVKIDIPLNGTIVGNILGNDGVVVCSEFTSDHWNFMTLEAPWDSSHPVSGTRQFGYEANLNGSFQFYVRGVDRFTSLNQERIADIILDDPFQKADELWEYFQESLNEFIIFNGGISSIIEPIKERPDWDKVKDVLEGSRPISDLECN